MSLASQGITHLTGTLMLNKIGFWIICFLHQEGQAINRHLGHDSVCCNCNPDAIRSLKRTCLHRSISTEMICWNSYTALTQQVKTAL